MTDFRKYRNLSLSHRVYSVLENLSKQLLPGTKLSISKTVETLVMERNMKAEDKLIAMSHPNIKSEEN